MKYFTTILFSVIISFQTSFGQDTTAQINTSWINLKTQLQRRTDIVSNLVSILSQSPKVDKEQLSKSKTFAINLFKYLDTLTLKDSLSISLANEKNNRLTKALARALATSDNDKKLRSNKKLPELFMQLEGCENRIALAKRDYNDVCNEYKRTDLLFGSDKVEKATEIKF